MDYVRQQIDGFTDHNMTAEYEVYDEAYTYQVSTVDPLPGGDGGAVVKVGNYYYRTLVNDNIGFPPEEYIGTKWIRWGISNAYAMLDLQADSKSYWTHNYATTGATQVVDVTIGDVVFETAVGYWEALTTRAAVDLNLETFVEGVDWTASANEMVVEFDRKDIDTLVIGNYTATSITIVALDDLGAPIVSSEQTKEIGVNDDVEDYYSYIYSLYSTSSGLDAVFSIPFVGLKIRVTFSNLILGAETSCGFLIGGATNNMGDSLFGVGFSFNSYSVKETDDFGVTTILKRGIQDLVDFETEIPSSALAATKRKIKLIYDEIVVFIVDPSVDSSYENLITLGVIDSVSTTLSNPVQSIISWSVQEVL